MNQMQHVINLRLGAVLQGWQGDSGCASGNSGARWSPEVAVRRARARVAADSTRAVAFAHRTARDECLRAVEAAERAGEL